MLTLSSGSGIEDDVLLPYELTGSEGLSEGYTYHLDCLSSDASLELKAFIGVPAQISLLTDSNEHRALCGIITNAQQNGADGGFIETSGAKVKVADTAKVSTLALPPSPAGSGAGGEGAPVSDSADSVPAWFIADDVEIVENLI